MFRVFDRAAGRTIGATALPAIDFEDSDAALELLCATTRKLPPPEPSDKSYFSAHRKLDAAFPKGEWRAFIGHCHNVGLIQRMAPTLLAHRERVLGFVNHGNRLALRATPVSAAKPAALTMDAVVAEYHEARKSPAAWRAFQAKYSSKVGGHLPPKKI